MRIEHPRKRPHDLREVARRVDGARLVHATVASHQPQE
jgi:hypothetical protein